MSKVKVSDYFSPEDLVRITDAVAEAEGKTSAEIVPYIVERSDDYEEALWRAGGLVSSLVLGTFGVLSAFTGVWLPFGLPTVVAIVLLSGAITMLKVRWLPLLRRMFAGKELMTLRVTRMAKEAFLTEEVFRTKERTGILLFISLLEHEVVVLTDTGIATRVAGDRWNSVVDCVLRGVRSGAPADGVIDAVRTMARLLEEHGLVQSMNDRNELPDRPRGQQ